MKTTRTFLAVVIAAFALFTYLPTSAEGSVSCQLEGDGAMPTMPPQPDAHSVWEISEFDAVTNCANGETCDQERLVLSNYPPTSLAESQANLAVWNAHLANNCESGVCATNFAASAEDPIEVQRQKMEAQLSIASSC